MENRAEAKYAEYRIQNRAFFLALFFSFLFSFVLVSCKSFIKVFPPENPKMALGELALAQELAQPQITSKNRWLYSYRLASALIQRKDLTTACPYLLDLMDESQFPLRDLARLKVYVYCHRFSHRALPPFHFSSYSTKQWTHSLVEKIYLYRLQQPYIADSPREVLRTLLRFADKHKKLRNKRKEVAFLSQALDWIEKHPKVLKTHREAVAQELYAKSPSHKPSDLLGENEWIAVARDYANRRQWKKAIYYYEKVLQHKEDDIQNTNKAYLGLYNVYYRMNRRDKSDEMALERLRWVSEQCSQEPVPDFLWEIYHDALHTFARRLWTNNENEKAVRYLKKGIQKLKGKYSRQQLYYVLGRIAHERRQQDQASKWFHLALQEKSLGASLLKEIYWKKSWSLLEQSKYREASVSLTHLLDFLEQNGQGFSDSSRFQYMFWLAFALNEMGNPTEAREKWQLLAKEDFMGYYGLVAHHYLGKDLPLLQSQPFKDKEDEDILIQHLGTEAFLILEWIYVVEEWDILKNTLDTYLLDWQESHIQDTDPLLAFFAYYAKARDFLPLFRRLYQLPADLQKKLLFSYAELLFPRIYEKEIYEAADTLNMEEDMVHLIYAIIRQESSFNWRARSPVGAIGLMQLMPDVARNINKREQLIILHSNKDIFKIENNILLGSSHLKELAKIYSKQFLLMAAEHNAGNSALSHWLATYKDPQKGMIFFIENIPYKETQGYVKLVLRNWIFYDLLKDGGGSVKKFPHELLEF